MVIFWTISTHGIKSVESDKVAIILKKSERNIDKKKEGFASLLNIFSVSHTQLDNQWHSSNHPIRQHR